MFILLVRFCGDKQKLLVGTGEHKNCNKRAASFVANS